MHGWRSRMRDAASIIGRDLVPVLHRIPAFFLILMREGIEVERQEKGKQDKGTFSRPVPSPCLHILFSRDMRLAQRDREFEISEKPPFLVENREMCRQSGAAR